MVELTDGRMLWDAIVGLREQTTSTRNILMYQFITLLSQSFNRHPTEQFNCLSLAYASITSTKSSRRSIDTMAVSNGILHVHQHFNPEEAAHTAAEFVASEFLQLTV